MRKKITLLLIFFTAMALNAQINTNIFGVVLGKSSPQDVKIALNQRGYKYQETNTYHFIGIHPIEGANFSGVKWEEVFFYFHSNKLYQIIFVKHPNGYSSQEVTFSLLKDKLRKKYKSLFDAENNEAVLYRDKKNDIMLSIDDNTNIIRLCYTNSYLYRLKKQSEIDDL